MNEKDEKNWLTCQRCGLHGPTIAISNVAMKPLDRENSRYWYKNISEPLCLTCWVALIDKEIPVETQTV